MGDSLSFSEVSEHSDGPRLHEKTVKFLARHVGLIVLILFAVVGIWVLDDYGVALDTGVQRDIAIRNLDYVLGRRDVIYPDGVKDNFYGVSFELPLLLLERALGLDDTRDVHLMRNIVTHLFFLAGGFFCYLLAYRLFGSRLLALLAMLLFLLHPRIYAHSFFNSKDIPFLSMFMICLYLTYWSFMKGGAWRFFALGVASGVLMNLRIMGVTLFVMVVCMQVLDVLQASSAGDRRRVLVTAGVFVLSCAVTLYAVSPYLLSDPFGNTIEWFAVFSQHPYPVDQMFRGNVIVSTVVNPPEYVPVWMSITTSPAVLVLGVAGMLIVFLRGASNPLDVIRNTRLRFGFMLVGCFMLPILAVIVLSSNVYHSWRQVYFLYAPFCILAMFGVHQLMSACIVLRLSRAFAFDGKGLMYGAYGIGLAVAVASMFSVHPHQHLYFNFLIDRTTPGYIRSEYELDYWLMTFREGYEHLLERHPFGSLHVHLPHAPSVELNWEILSESDRERLILQGEHFDFYITSYKDWLPSESARRDVTAPLVHGRVIYNSKVLGVAAVDLSLVDDGVAAPYRDAYSATVSKQPDARSNWDVYMDDGALVYIKESCTASDFSTPFLVHGTTDDIDDLPGRRRSDGHSTRNLDFEFGRFGVRFDEICVATVPLPADGVSGVRTGQFTSHGELWSASLNMKLWGASAYGDEYESVVRGNPVINSEFDVYLYDGRLVYVREPCVASDTEAEFFLHVVPSDVSDLPPPRKESGFDNLDFVFETRGLMFDGMCVASIGLPDYAIKRVTTGQHGDEGDAVWSASYNVSAGDELSRFVEQMRGRGAEATVSSYFDVYLQDGRLIYFRADCVAGDVQAPFFVHLYPVDLDELSPGRQSLGFDSFSFGLLDRGAMSGDGCFTSFDLPNYDVAGFLTGQFQRDEGNLWEGAYSFVAAELPSIVEELRERGVEPVVHSYFDIYLENGRLIYFRADCTAEGADAPFFVHVYPADVGDLPTERRDARFDSFSFGLLDRGVMVEGGCVTSFDLPDYDVAGFLTGQFQRDAGNLWEGGYSFAAAELPRVLDRLRDRGFEPVARSYFDVYMDDGRLIYVRDPCDASDVESEFFLHVVSSSVDDLPQPRRKSGFDNLDFVFETRGLMFDGMCVASIGLPDYDIERIRTGQWDPEQQRDIWKEEFEVIE